MRTSHDERVMTAIARSKARTRCNAMARCNAKFCELTDAKFEAGEYFRAHERAMTERADTSGITTRLRLNTSRPLRHSELVEMQWTELGHSELFGQESVARRAFSVSLLNDISAFCSRGVHQSCNPRERRTVEIHTCCRQ